MGRGFPKLTALFSSIKLADGIYLALIRRATGHAVSHEQVHVGVAVPVQIEQELYRVDDLVHDPGVRPHLFALDGAQSYLLHHTVHVGCVDDRDYAVVERTVPKEVATQVAFAAPEVHVLVHYREDHETLHSCGSLHVVLDGWKRLVQARFR